MGAAFHGRVPTPAILVVTLAVCAAATAKGTVDLLVAAYLPPYRLGQSQVDGPTAPRPPGSRNPAAADILARNIFDSQTGALWPPRPPRERRPDGDLVGPPGDGALPPCGGDARLVAALHVPGHLDWSVAALSMDRDEPRLFHTGARVDGKQVSAIHATAVVLEAGDRSCALTMFDGPRADGGRLSPPGPGMGRPRHPSAGGAMPASGITKLDDTHFTVTRGFVEALLSDQAALMGLARVVPHKREGELLGVKLYGIRKRNALGQLGLQNGDLLRTLNGHDLSSPDSALEAYTRLRSADQLSLAITRRGRHMTLAYAIE